MGVVDPRSQGSLAHFRRSRLRSLMRGGVRRTLGAIGVLVLAVLALGAIVGFRDRAFLYVELGAIALVLVLASRVQASRRGGGD
jgi:hypothetical protein